MATDKAARTPPVNWKAAVFAGLIAGLAFLVWELVLVGITTGSPWGPTRMIGAIVLGRDVLPPPPSFDLVVFLAAGVVHFGLSVLLAVLFAAIAGRLSPGMVLPAGAAFGLATYLVNFYGMTAAFPWFAEARNWISLVGHLLFGVVLAWAYQRLSTRT